MMRTISAITSVSMDHDRPPSWSVQSQLSPLPRRAGCMDGFFAQQSRLERAALLCVREKSTATDSKRAADMLLSSRQFHHIF